MDITVAKNAGFCFGVKRATDNLESAIEHRKGEERIYTLGTIIHNGTYNAKLREKGVNICSIADVRALANSACESSPVKIFIRAHGIPLEDESLLEEMAEKNRFFSYVDCTCPFVKKIHSIAREHSSPDNVFLLFGTKDHPEVVGIMSRFEHEKYVFASADELEDILKKEFFVKMNKKTPILAAQTTQKLSEWRKAQEILKKVYTNPLIFDSNGSRFIIRRLNC